MERINRDLEARRKAAEIIGISESANKEELKAAYKKAALKHHPDRNGNTPEADRYFKLVRWAYEFLAYDAPNDPPPEELESFLHETAQANGEEKYNTDNQWGRLLWWKDRFFSEGE